MIEKIVLILVNVTLKTKRNFMLYQFFYTYCKKSKFYENYYYNSMHVFSNTIMISLTYVLIIIIIFIEGSPISNVYKDTSSVD